MNAASLKKPPFANTRTVLILMLICIAMMRLFLIFVNEANWDEYLNLSMVYMHDRGELDEVLQTGFVHLFKWVPLVSTNEADQIIAARLLYFIVALVTSLAIWGVARTFVSVNGALFVVLCYWAIDYNFIHAVSLRTDPLSACAMMCTLYLIVSRPPTFSLAICAGILTGLAGFFTIKAIFYVPPLVLVAMLRYSSFVPMYRSIVLVLLAGCMAVFSFICFNAIHATTFKEMASPLAFLTRTSSSTLGVGQNDILSTYLLGVFVNNLAVFIVMIISFCLLLVQLRNTKDRKNTLICLALITPAISLFIYRDSYPYFYPFILAPIIIVCCSFWEALSHRGYDRILLAISAVIFLNPVQSSFKHSQRSITKQRNTLNAIHQMFPNPVTYIDGRSMVASLPKRGLFMSTWGMTDYRHLGLPIMEQTILAEQPQFLLANTPYLQIDKFTPAESQSTSLGLLAPDVSILKESFVQFWGPVYIPAKNIRPENNSMRILISGNYRLVTDAPILIDGKTLELNETIYLETGNYEIASRSHAKLILDVAHPAIKPPPQRLFSGF